MFVSTTLVQIVEGVEQAIAEVSQKSGSGRINPIRENEYYSNPKDVEFDVAVTVTDSVSGKAEGGIRIPVLRAVGQGEKSLENRAVSRIRFSVPLSVPSTPGEQYPSSGGSLRSQYPSFEAT